MANIWTDARSRNDENRQYAPVRNKQTPNNGSRSVKKSSAFSEIKNVMHNQIYATPLRVNAAKVDGLPKSFVSSKSLCTEVLRKQQLKQNFANAQNKLEGKIKSIKKTEIYNEPVFDEELFDSWDMDRVCCQQPRSEAEIWSEMDMLDMKMPNLNFGSSTDDDFKKDLAAFIPDLDVIPDIIPDIDEIEPENIHDFDFGIPMLSIEDFDQFKDELPF